MQAVVLVKFLMSAFLILSLLLKLVIIINQAFQFISDVLSLFFILDKCQFLALVADHNYIQQPHRRVALLPRLYA